ncbi:hypothetical protein [uncultured Desulfovibrio sp.]|nr:hypothetical protein [uncultured Desulfovibrio sp.]
MLPFSLWPHGAPGWEQTRFTVFAPLATADPKFQVQADADAPRRT